MAKQQWPYAWRIVHLLGGLYAINPPQDDEVRLYASSPADDDNILCAFKIPAYEALFKWLQKLGLQALGTVFVTDERQQEGIYPPEARHYYRSPQRNDPWAVWAAAQTWNQIAHHAATNDANILLMDLARRISFELYACSAKWFDLSHAYGTVLSGQIKSGELRASQRFDNMNAFSLHLAIHSVLSETSSLRDYLAEFVAQHVLASELPGNPYTKMAKLADALRKQPGITHPLAATITTITSENEGWLHTLSAYRDLIIHHAPAAMTEGVSFVMLKEIELRGGYGLPYIETYLPADPVAVKKERVRGTSMRTLVEWNRVFSPTGVAGGPDALTYLHNAVGQLALLSLEMASHSPIKPAPIVVTPKPGRVVVQRE